MTRTTMVVAAALTLAAFPGQARDKEQRVASYEPRIVCGQTGCFNVPPGCAGELRRSGRTVVAVVNCRKQ